MELQSTLQVSAYTFYPMLRQSLPLSKKYLAINQSLSPIDTVDLGASIAETYGKAIGPVERKLCTYYQSLLIKID
jgi:hypothetical protein